MVQEWVGESVQARVAEWEPARPLALPPVQLAGGLEPALALVLGQEWVGELAQVLALDLVRVRDSALYWESAALESVEERDKSW